MRVCFLVPELSASGGVAVALGYARELAERRGFEVDVLALADGTPAGSYDVVVATWWRTAELAWQIDAKHRVLFLQGPDAFYYRQEETLYRVAAALPLRMPFEVVAVSSWLARLVDAARPGAPCRVVHTGINKETFGSVRRERHDGPLRVLIEGQPSLWFKGVRDALAATRAMSRPAQVTVVSLDPSAERDLGDVHVVGGLGPAEMAALYAQHDVLLKLSRFEGFGLAPVEAFHAGVPCIVTPYGGHADYVRHGHNGLLAGFDDPAAVTGWLDGLAAEPALLERLSQGALESAAAWPAWEDSAKEFESALREIAKRKAPAPDAAVAGMAALVRGQAELGHAQLKHLAGSLEWTEDALAHARSEVHRLSVELGELERMNELIDELFKSREECAQMLESERAALAEIKESRAYRATVALRRLKPGR